MNDRLHPRSGPAITLPTRYESVYLTSAGIFLPGSPVDNDSIDQFIAPLNRNSERIKRHVLRDNGIKLRHFAIDREGESLYSSSQMAARAIDGCLAESHVRLSDVTLLCTGLPAATPGCRVLQTWSTANWALSRWRPAAIRVCAVRV